MGKILILMLLPLLSGCASMMESLLCPCYPPGYTEDPGKHVWASETFKDPEFWKHRDTDDEIEVVITSPIVVEQAPRKRK
jgi:hypothetical protein